MSRTSWRWGAGPTYVMVGGGIIAFISGFFITQVQYATYSLEEVANMVAAILVPLYSSILFLVVPLSIVKVHKGGRGVIVNVPTRHGAAPKDVSLIFLMGSVLAGVIIWALVYSVAPELILGLGRFMMTLLYGSFVIYLPLLCEAVYGNMRLPASILATMLMLALVAAGSALAAGYPM